MPELEETLTGQLIGSFFRFLKTPWHMVPAPGLSRTETAVLLTIHRQNFHKKPCRVSDLSQKLHVSAPTMTQHVSNLERRGFVQKKPDPQDKRAVRLSLTGLGLEVLEQHRKAMERNIEELIAQLGEENAKKLVELLTKTSDFFGEKTREFDPPCTP